ncbi:hypothetical protein C7M84_016214 [Penaeus vannamei]|uniref:Nucleolar protein 10 n=1 Tax=Penaeus vannamei TaxID=6689 RepID=A0A423SNL1_PENVA|nr:hypothetical protein C7M84_016214 [Penaeus vannamei]
MDSHSQSVFRNLPATNALSDFALFVPFFPSLIRSQFPPPGATASASAFRRVKFLQAGRQTHGEVSGLGGVWGAAAAPSAPPLPLSPGPQQKARNQGKSRSQKGGSSPGQRAVPKSGLHKSRTRSSCKNPEGNGRRAREATLFLGVFPLDPLPWGYFAVHTAREPPSLGVFPYWGQAPRPPSLGVFSYWGQAPGSPFLRKVDPEGRPTASAHPARFSPEDKYSRQRIVIKRRFGLLLTQQPAVRY